MPEEEQYEPSKREIKQMKKKLQKKRNAANDAEAVRIAVDAVALAPETVGAIAKGIGIADRVTGGAISNAAGHLLAFVNRFPGGRIPQAVLNKLVESGAGKVASSIIGMKSGKKGDNTSDRIKKATNKKNDLPNKKNDLQNQQAKSKNTGGKGSGIVPGKNNTDMSKKEVQEQMSDGGGGSFKSTAKFLKISLIALIPVLLILVFMNLMVSSSIVFLNVIGLGQADNVSDAEVEESIRKNGIKGLYDELTDENLDIGFANDIYIKELTEENFISSLRPYNEADLKELEDFYSNIESYKNNNFDMDVVYKFFFKLYYLKKHYDEQYNIDLDLPLILSILSIQSENIGDVFESNIKDYKISLKQDNPNFKHDKDWSNQKLSKDNSSYDIEILAQNMVSVRTDMAEKGCENTIVDGKCYELVSDQEYKEFLKEFLEKKYYLDGNYTIDNPDSSLNPEDNVETTPETPSDSNNTTPAKGNFREWTQCNQEWSNYTVPTSSSNMCEIGCLITSITMQIARSGTLVVSPTLDPGVALDYFDFASGGDLYWSSVTNLAPNFEYYTAINLVGMSRSNIAKKLSGYDSSKYYMVLAVGNLDRDYDHHYVALDYIDSTTNDIYIMDPVSTSMTKLYDYYKIYTANIYMKKD